MSNINIRMTECTIGAKAFDVYKVDAFEHLSSPFRVVVQLVSSTQQDTESLVYNESLVTMTSDAGDRYFHGIVATAHQQNKAGKYFICTATIVPKFWMLGKKTDVRIFQEMSTPDIIKQVLEDNGIVSLDYDLRLNGTYAKREYCVQYRESCKAFLERLMAEEGIFYYFEIKDQKHVMVFGDKYLCHKPIPNKNEVDFLEKNQLSGRGECVQIFNTSNQIYSGKAVIKDYDFTTPDKLPSSEKKGSKYNELELYDYPGLILDDSTGTRRSESDLYVGEFGQLDINGTGNCKRFSPGYSFKMINHPLGEMDGEYILYDVEHHIVQGQAIQELAAEGNKYQNHFLCVPEKTNLRTAKKLKPSVQGIQTAVVTGPSGEEIYTDEYGRIKVQFHWDREGENDEKSSCWMRVAQPWAGSGWGSVFIPRIGQEVIISFVDGDPDRPMVTGAVYNGNNMPPYDLPAEKTKSTLKTQSTKGASSSNYNELRFEDLKDSEEIYLQAEKDWNIEVKNDKGQHVGNDETLTVDNDRTKEVGNNQSVSIGNNHTETIGKNMSLTVVKNLDETIQGNKSMNITGNHTEEIGKKMKLTVGANAELSITKDLSIIVADNTVINSGKQIEIVTGSASIIMKKNGDIQIKGKNITIDGSGNMVLKAKKISQN